MGVRDQIKIMSGSLLDVFYPNLCHLCLEDLKLNETHVCLSCSFNMPYIGQTDADAEKLKRLFWGRVEVENVHALLNYQKGNQVQLLLHQLKYKNKVKLGQYYGRLLGGVMLGTRHFSRILPVPLHPKKFRQRGFNQSTAISKGIASILNLPIDEMSLRRNQYNDSQTKFSKFDRWENVKSIFSVVKPKNLENQHVLLVDDVLTTGATIEACVSELLKVKNCTVSIATLAARI